MNTQSNQRGNAIVITLIFLIVAGAGVVVYLSQQGKLNIPGLTPNTGVDSQEVASVEGSASEPEVVIDENPVVAKVGKSEITRQDVIAMMNSVPPQMRQLPPEQLFPMILDQMINNKIVDAKASKSGLEKDKEVKAELEKVKEQIVRTKFIEQEIAKEVTEDKLKAEYETYLEGYTPVEEVKAAHILVEDEKVAKDIIAKLNAGEDFAALAGGHSIDGTAQNGGDLGYFAKGEVVPEFADAAFALDAGSYSKSPVKSSFGYHIIRVDEKRQRPPQSFEEMTPVLQGSLRREAYESLLTKWKDGAEVERFDINGKPLQEQEPAAGGDVDAEQNAPSSAAVQEPAAAEESNLSEE